MTKPDRYVSKSQLETFGEQCQRKWGFDKLDGVRFSKPAADLGNAAHDVLEEYVKHGTHPEDYPAFPEGKHRIDPRAVALRGLHLAPEPGTGKCEDEINFTDDAGVTYYGFVDWHEPWPENVKSAGGGVDLLDYKTTGNMKYAHNTNSLWSDVQATIYARALMEKYAAETVWLKWLYISTVVNKAPKPRLVEVELNYNDVLRGWQPITDAALEVYRARDTYTRAHQLPQNLRHCKAYGGCEYQDMCLTSSQVLALSMNEPDDTVEDFVPLSRLVEIARHQNQGENEMSMKDKLKKRAQQAGRSVGEPMPEPQNPPSLADVAVGQADPQAIPSDDPAPSVDAEKRPGKDPAEVAEAYARQEAEAKARQEAASRQAQPDTHRINAPETAATNEFDASKAEEQIAKLKADVRKAKTAGAKASKEALAQVLAASVHGKGVDEGIKACDWWLKRFGEEA